MSQPDHDDDGWRCCYVGDRGERCHYAGALSHETRGGGRWFCRFHFNCPSAAEGAEIVVQSRDWIRGEAMPIRANPDADDTGDSPTAAAIRKTLIVRAA